MYQQGENKRQIRIFELSRKIGISSEKIKLVLSEYYGQENLYINNSALLKKVQLDVIAKYFNSIVFKLLAKVYKQRDTISESEREHYVRIFNLFVNHNPKSSSSSAALILADAISLNCNSFTYPKSLNLEEIFEYGLNPHLIQGYFFEIVFNSESKDFKVPFLEWKSLIKILNRTIVLNLNWNNRALIPIVYLKNYYNFSDDDVEDIYDFKFKSRLIAA
jgi:hypothetical protein